MKTPLKVPSLLSSHEWENVNTWEGHQQKQVEMEGILARTANRKHTAVETTAGHRNCTSYKLEHPIGAYVEVPRGESESFMLEGEERDLL